jgi:hypothetical protein
MLAAGFSRSREFLADRVAVSLYGKGAFLSGLTKVATDGTLFEGSVYGNVAALLDQGKGFVNVYETFRSYRDEGIPAEEREALYYYSVICAPCSGRVFPAGASPARLTRSLQPEALGAAVEATKPSEPSRSGTARRCREPPGRNTREGRAGLERYHVGADPPVPRGRPPSWASRQTGGRGRPTSEPTQRSHRGLGHGLRAHGRPLQHKKPRSMEPRDLQPDAHAGQAGSKTGVADRPVGPQKPGNSGRGKGPEFQTSVPRGTRTRSLA